MNKPTEAAKKLALSLRKNLDAQCGVKIKHGQALNLIAALTGTNDWNALSAALNATRESGMEWFTATFNEVLLEGPDITDTGEHEVRTVCYPAKDRYHADRIATVLETAVEHLLFSQRMDDNRPTINSYVQKGRTDDGEKEFKKLLKEIEQEVPRTSFRLGNTEISSGDFELTYGRVITINGKTFHAHEFLNGHDRIKELMAEIVATGSHLKEDYIDYDEDHVAFVPFGKKFGEDPNETMWSCDEWQDPNQTIEVIGAIIGFLHQHKKA